MVNYQNGKIYKIEDVGGNMCYIGSTTKDFLSKRMVEHRSAYKNWKLTESGGKCSVCGIFDQYGVDNCKIVLIESYPCNTKDELGSREAHFIRSMNCVNKTIPNRDLKQYYIDNQDHIKETSMKSYLQHKDQKKEAFKKYYNAHKEIQKDRASVVYACECGSDITRGARSRHIKTKKHLDYIANIPLEV